VTCTQQDRPDTGANVYACEYTDSADPADALDGFNLVVYRGGDPTTIMKNLAAALTSGATPTSAICDRTQLGDGEIDIVVGTDVVVASDAVHEGQIPDLDPRVHHLFSNPAWRATIIAWARSATCSFRKMFEM
jgi:hypothetical protein